jgi:hypothetical protein
MIARQFLLASLLFSLAGCAAFTHKPYAKTDEKPKPLKEASDDVSYKAFLGTLREAVAKKDMAQIASMMTPDFGYRWDNPPPGENVFHYWDENGIWPELAAVLSGDFASYGNYMVAPKEFAQSPDSYHGYRAGITRVGGSWKFAYFVTD